MATDKQIAANRANALKSTGPRTPEGKAIVAQNGLRHGLLAKSFVLRSECSDTFRAFVETFYREYEPRTASERALVDGMAMARWRLIRMGNLEAASLDHESEQFEDPDASFSTQTTLAHRQAVSSSRSLDLLNRSEARLQRQFDSAYDRLRLVQADRRRQENDRDGLVPPPPSCVGSDPISECYEQY